MKLTPLFDEVQIREAIQAIATKIKAHWQDESDIHVVVLMDGGMWFAADLLRELPVSYVFHTLRVSSYGHAHSSSGQLQWLGALPDLSEKKILLLDDVIDTGLTLHELSHALKESGAKEVRTAVAVAKGGCRRYAIEADFIALHANDDFLVGYGMDEQGRYRNLPYIAIASVE